ncbi:hypothetical protein [Haloarcula nitratireducens]|uniref:Uncharacterized protein n=1 Tax=Haloarcula nitratireducens TaxID=2487749 RepID=A0AAW4P999_9EURY|nr:hypothetical protein [Halomicroarcula nitratireducens]MBX0294095.1 hypothetical protein [Halomicroarcula nitratireducens]
MPTDDTGDPTPEDYAEYCQTQAALLAGRIETMREDVDELLADVEAETAAVREELDRAKTDSPTGPTSPDAGRDPEADVEAIEAKQETIREKQAAMETYRDLADGYADLAERLSDQTFDASEALVEVVRFETERDAAACFDRTTLAETVADAAEDEQSE